MRAEADEEVVALLIEHGVGKRGARGDDFYYVALDYALGLFGVFDLLADGDLAPELDEFSQIAFHGVMGHASEGQVAGFAGGTRGQGKAQQACAFFGVVAEHLVEVAHAEEEDCVGVLTLKVHVLLHRRREFGSGWHSSVGAWGWEK